MHVVLADPPSFTPPYDHELASALARAGATVELVTSPFRFGARPEPDGYELVDGFYGRSSGIEHGALRRAAKTLEHPLAMRRLIVWFTAGPTTYDFEIQVASPVFKSIEAEPHTSPPGDEVGEATVGRVSLTPDQKLLIVALCEPFLRRREAGTTQIPSSAAAAERLGWTLTRLNRKLDNVCQKLADAGTRGLHGGVGRVASNRKARLVEHALSTKLVVEDDLGLIDQDATSEAAEAADRGNA